MTAKKFSCIFGLFERFMNLNIEVLFLQPLCVDVGFCVIHWQKRVYLDFVIILLDTSDYAVLFVGFFCSNPLIWNCFNVTPLNFGSSYLLCRSQNYALSYVNTFNSSAFRN